MPDGFADAAALLGDRLRFAALALPEPVRESAEEFRLRRGRDAAYLLPEGEKTLLEGHPLSARELAETVERATASSLHAYMDELRQGYITARGGVRLGICGTAVAQGRISGIRDYSSLNIRIPRQVRGAGARVIPELLRARASVLILSPPGGGKTTFLRELVRESAESGLRVALADERGEVAAAWQGMPRFELGRCTDVLTGAQKAEAAMLLLRAMNPQVIALDEITAREDLDAIEQISACGVRLYATAHAAGPAQLAKRPLYRRLLTLEAFELAVSVTVSGGERQYRVTRLCGG